MVENSLSSKVTSLDECINVASYRGASLKVCYTVSDNKIHLVALFTTPYVKDFDIGKATIDSSNPTAVINSESHCFERLHDFQGVVTMSFDFKINVLTISGKICIPLADCGEDKVSVLIPGIISTIN